MKLIKKIYKWLVPKKFELANIYRYLLLTKKLESEMFIVKDLCLKKRNAIDIGANIGLFTYFFSKHFEKVISFEPLNEVTSKLIESNLINVELKKYALSDKNSSSKIYIPKIDGEEFVHSRASLRVQTHKSKEQRVETRRLDDFEFVDVDLIKIDVEGHEMEVIIGGQKTIKKFMPIMLIELEERHLNYSPIKIISKLEQWGYECYILKNKNMIRASEVSFLENQRRCVSRNDYSDYINNFIFIPKQVSS